MKGAVYLVGAGPGNPDLITVRGSELLRKADVVVMDALVDPALVKGLRAKIMYAGKRGHSEKNTSQDFINRLLVRLGKQGKRVVRLKGGDPFVFGRGSEELEALQNAGVPCEVVPGISSAIAAPAAAGIPVTERRWASQVTILTGHGQAETRGADPVSPKVNWRKLPHDGTLVVLMGVASWKNISRKLLVAGWPSSRPVVAVESGTNPNQRVVRTTLGHSTQDFEKRRLTAPAVIVVGDVARLAARGRRIVVTRPLGQSEELIRRLEDKGADVVVAPAIKIEPIHVHFMTTQNRYDAVIFLSANAVRTFMNNKLMNLPAVAVGPETRRVAEEWGWKVRKMPSHHSSDGVLAALGNVRGKSFLVPRVQNAPEGFVRTLRSRGARVQEVVIYKTSSARFTAPVKKIILNGVDAVTYTSASTVRGFTGNFTRAQIQKIFRTAKAVSMGPQTTAELKRAGLRSVYEAKKSTIADLIEVLFP